MWICDFYYISLYIIISAFFFVRYIFYLQIGGSSHWQQYSNLTPTISQISLNFYDFHNIFIREKNDAGILSVSTSSPVQCQISSDMPPDSLRRSKTVPQRWLSLCEVSLRVKHSPSVQRDRCVATRTHTFFPSSLFPAFAPPDGSCPFLHRSNNERARHLLHIHSASFFLFYVLRHE